MGWDRLLLDHPWKTKPLSISWHLELSLVLAQKHTKQRGFDPGMWMETPAMLCLGGSTSVDMSSVGNTKMWDSSECKGLENAEAACFMPCSWYTHGRRGDLVSAVLSGWLELLNIPSLGSCTDDDTRTSCPCLSPSQGTELAQLLFSTDGGESTYTWTLHHNGPRDKALTIYTPYRRTYSCVLSTCFSECGNWTFCPILKVLPVR